MADKTGIEWTDASWNAVTGCDHVSAGCDHCYAEALSLRLQAMGQPKYAAGFAVRIHEKDLTLPLKWKAPRRIFVNSMSDQWHVAVPREFTDRMFAVMAMSPQHTFQVLTKRPQRAANYLDDPETKNRIRDHLYGLVDSGGKRVAWPYDAHMPWPLPNVWIGTSVEDSRVAHRIDALRKCPAAVRFLSCEPLIGPLPLLDLSGIGWVIAGGESGTGHRSIDPEWVRDLRDRCVASAVPFFFKQWSGQRPKSNGRLLDGVEWSQFPTVGQAVRP